MFFLSNLSSLGVGTKDGTTERWTRNNDSIVPSFDKKTRLLSGERSRSPHFSCRRPPIFDLLFDDAFPRKPRSISLIPLRIHALEGGSQLPWRCYTQCSIISFDFYQGWSHRSSLSVSSIDRISSPDWYLLLPLFFSLVIPNLRSSIFVAFVLLRVIISTLGSRKDGHGPCYFCARTALQEKYCGEEGFIRKPLPAACSGSGEDLFGGFFRWEKAFIQLGLLTAHISHRFLLQHSRQHLQIIGGVFLSLIFQRRLHSDLWRG